MRAKLIPLIFLMTSSVFAGGFILKEENDFFSFPGSDRYYTQGLELQYVGDPVTTNKVTTRQLYGLRNLMYTPRHISVAELQPDDRPWAGLSAASYTTWKFDKNEFVSFGWLVGTVGPWAQSEYFQTAVHRLIKNKLPMGWTNQVPNEPILNYTEDHFREIYLAGSHGSWGFDIVEDYGFSLGNAFVYGDGGFSLRAGWGIPRDCQTIIEPTLAWNKMSFYVFAGANGKLMFHNIMLGGSLFQDGPSQDLRLFVLDVDGGASLIMRNVFGGLTDFGLTYTFVQRSKEFDGQENPQRFGNITLAFARGF